MSLQFCHRCYIGAVPANSTSAARGFSFSALIQKLPSQCAVCHAWPSSPVCAPCVARFAGVAQRCRLCAISLPADLSSSPASSNRVRDVCLQCILQPPPVDSTVVAVDYAFPWSGLVAQYKFADQPGWASFFAQLLLKAPGVQQAFDALDARDLILPMPLSKERLQIRGFNQALELAAQLTRRSATRGKLDPALLLRIKNTRPQTELRRRARLDNVSGAFALEPLRADGMQGRRVVLVDDVMTSGASLFTAASVLRAAGAAHVVALSLARTPQ